MSLPEDNPPVVNRFMDPVTEKPVSHGRWGDWLNYREHVLTDTRYLPGEVDDHRDMDRFQLDEDPPMDKHRSPSDAARN